MKKIKNLNPTTLLIVVLATIPLTWLFIMLRILIENIK